MLRLRSVLLCAVATLVACSSAFAGDRYFFHSHGKAYFCLQPSSYQEGCFRVCEDESVIRIGEYPTITTARAEKLCGTDGAVAQATIPVAAQEIVAQPALPPSPNDQPTPAGPLQGPADLPHHPNPECCDSEDVPPGTLPCWPHLHASCHCRAEGTTTLAPCTPQGKLNVHVTAGSSYYLAIFPITGTIPVPQINLSKNEVYLFAQQTLKYDCAKEIAESEHAAACNFEHPCHDPCVVHTCRVDCRKTQCEARCVLAPQTGPLVLAIRRAGTNYYVDVFVGKQAAGSPLATYPSCTMILHDVPLGELNSRLGLTGAGAITTPEALLQANPGASTDLFAFL